MISLFGATGYTGRLVAEALVRRGLPVRIVGRSEQTLRALAQHHGGLDWAVADVYDEGSLEQALDGTKVLISTVGPFTWWGAPAVEYAIRHGIPYFDSTGEPPFVRRVFDQWGPRAAKSGATLVTAFGYDYVPGNLAGALALERAGELATKVEIGYFAVGARSPSAFSAGTIRSARAVLAARHYALRGGQVVEERAAKEVLNFPVRGKQMQAMTIGASEQFGLPQSFPQLTDASTALGWFGPAAKPIQMIGSLTDKLGSMPFVRDAVASAGSRIREHRTEPGRPAAGPSADARANVKSIAVARALSASGAILAESTVEGPNPYSLTGELLAWGAEQALGGALKGTGALGPVAAFGLNELVAGCKEIGLVETKPAANH